MLSLKPIRTDLSCRILQAEPRSESSSAMTPLNSRLQAVSIELLQNLVSRGELDEISLATIEAAVVGKLYYCVHSRRLDVQNKLLHLLHSVISASVATRLKARQLAERKLEASSSRRQSLDDSAYRYATNPLLIQTLVDGITVIHNRSVYQHWLDFILMTVPQFSEVLKAAIGPLNESICRQLRVALSEISRASRRSRGDVDDVKVIITDAELLMYLNALERLVLLGVSSAPLRSQAEDDNEPSEKTTTQDGGGLFGIVSTVFSSDNVAQPNPEQLTVSILHLCH
jgi:hypothetical protein